MTGVAGDRVLRKVDFVRTVDQKDHLQHSAARQLLRFVIAFPNPFPLTRLRVPAGIDVTKVALLAKGYRHEIHQPVELRVRYSFEHLEVLAWLFGGLRGRRLLL